MTISSKTVIRKYGTGNTFYITIPSYVAQDSQFPFNDGEVVNLRIDGKRLIVEKIE